MLAFDFHMHTGASPDSHTSPEELANAALAAGLTHIAITDHYEAPPADPNLFPDKNPRWLAAAADRYREVEANSQKNIAAVQALTAGKLSVAMGMELGNPLEDLPRTEELIAAHDFDFLLASQHTNPGGPDFYFLQRFPELDLMAEMDIYFGELLKIVEWGNFSSLAHLTYPFRYFPADKRPTNTRRWDEIINRILRLLAEKGLALEINTSGLRKEIGEVSPALPLIRRFRELGGELITVGSDAHTPADVGAGIATAVELAEAAGFRYITRYEKRKPIPEKIK